MKVSDYKNKNLWLMQGDCLERMKEIPDSSVDAIICDPPYGTTACKWDSIIPLQLMWEEINRVVKPKGVTVLFGNQPFTSILVESNYKAFKQSLVWKKNKVTGFLNAKKQHMRCHEDIIVFYTGQCTYNPQKSSGHKPVNAYTKHTSDGDTVGKTVTGISGGGSTERYPTSILEFSVVNQDGTSDGGRWHPTQKPVTLMEYLIKTYTNENETVLDFTMGSGTTGVGCMNTGRKFIGIEKDEAYFEVAYNRIKGGQQ